MIKKIEKLIKKDFNTKTTYDDDDKYIKIRIKTYKDIEIVYKDIKIIWRYR